MPKEGSKAFDACAHQPAFDREVLEARIQATIHPTTTMGLALTAAAVGMQAADAWARSSRELGSSPATSDVRSSSSSSSSSSDKKKSNKGGGKSKKKDRELRGLSRGEIALQASLTFARTNFFPSDACTCTDPLSAPSRAAKEGDQQHGHERSGHTATATAGASPL